MPTPVLWKRPDLVYPSTLDTIFFDVDGVLINTTDTFRAADIAVTEYVAGTIHGLDWGQEGEEGGERGKHLVTIEDVNAFKQAGGYNNDWDMCYLLAALCTARLREWKGTSLAERGSQEWAALSRAANLQGHGGAEWVDAVIPASARLDYHFIGDLYHEYYWGTDELQKRYGHPPRYLKGAPGFVHREEMLFSPDLPARLRQSGVRHLGMITGRVGPEVDSALERLKAYCGERWWEVIISADLCPKPDPRALQLVINYQASKKAGDPEILAAMLVHEDEVEVYQQRGADVIIGGVEDVLACLPEKIK